MAFERFSVSIDQKDNLQASDEIKGYIEGLLEIEKACRKIWTGPQRGPQHSHYTDHGIKHSKKISKAIEALLEGKNIVFNPLEEFLLQAAIYLHDVGMQCKERNLLSEKPFKISKNEGFPFSVEVLENIRENHHILSYKMIIFQNSTTYKVPDLGIKNLDLVPINIIALLCKAHAEKNEQFREPFNEDPIFHDAILRLELLAVLLRLGDALDADSRRCCDIEDFRVIEDNLTILSKAHYWKHQYTSSIKINKGRISFVYSIPPKYDNIKNGIIQLAEKDIRTHLPILDKVWEKYDIPLHVGDPIFTNMGMLKGDVFPISDDVIKYFQQLKAAAPSKHSTDVFFYKKFCDYLRKQIEDINSALGACRT